MRKNILSMSIAAMIGGLGLAGGAAAQVGHTPVPPAPTATAMAQTDTGIGHQLIVPYFTTQDGNTTLLSITNTDVTNGKAVKVRFRGAANSDDLFDFQVFLSPGDVWTANLSKEAAGLADDIGSTTDIWGKAYTGRTKLTTSDLSCTLPEKKFVNGRFLTERVNMNSRDIDNETREGYVEIINMADIPYAGKTGVNPLWTAIKHVEGAVPPGCATVDAVGPALAALATFSSALSAADVLTAAASLGLSTPTSGLFSNFAILNVPNTTAWSGEALSLEAQAEGVSTAANVVYSPQTRLPANPDWARATADPLILASVIPALQYDLPDLSTPYVGLNTAPFPGRQAGQVSALLAKASIINEWITADSINASTDWVFSMPTRRYSVALNYYTRSAQFNSAVSPNSFTNKNVTVAGLPGDEQVCVMGIGATMWNREEVSYKPGAGIIVSPTPAVFFCGEVNVASFNEGGSNQASGALASTVARSDFTAAALGGTGWANISTLGLNAGNELATDPKAASTGLPIVGSAYTKLFNGGVRPGVAGTYGLEWKHRFTRPIAITAP